MYSRSFLIETFICAATNAFSRELGELTFDERYLCIMKKKQGYSSFVLLYTRKKLYESTYD